MAELRAELRADEARCGFESLVPEAVAAAGIAVPFYAASGSKDNTVRLWGVDDGECKRVLVGAHVHRGAAELEREGNLGMVWSVAFAPARPGEAALLASGSTDGTIRLWGVDDGECKRVLEGHSGTVYSVAFAPARPGEAALLASGADDNTVRLWGVDDGECKLVLEGHSGTELGLSVYSVAFAPARPGEAALLASASEDNTVRLWGVDDGECKRVLKGHSNSVLSVNIGYVLPDQN